jgi:hypothetical protein
VRNIRHNRLFRLRLQRARCAGRDQRVYPLFYITLSSKLTALAMSLSSVQVVTNAPRLRTARLGAAH